MRKRESIAVMLFLLLFCEAEASGPSYRYKFKMIKPIESDTRTMFGDDFTAQFPLDRIQFSFTIKNKTDQPMFLDWNQASYVDPSGKTHRVIHKGVRLIERDKEMAPSVIPPGATLSEIIVPSEYIDYNTGLFGRSPGRWEVAEMFPKPERGRHLIGKTFSIFLPLKVKGEQQYHTFVFQIDIEEEVKR